MTEHEPASDSAPSSEAPESEVDTREDDVPVVTGAVVPVERAVEHLPSTPTGDEFRTLAAMAKVMADASIVPSPLRGKPHDVFVVLWTGRDLGIPLTSALRLVYVVDGQPSLAPKLLMARVRQLGLGRIVPGPDNNAERAEAVALTPDGAIMGPPAVFTWAMAQAAGLVRPDCTPHEHSSGCKGAQRGGGCKSNWRTYPERMLWWRAAGNCVDDYFPEAGLGLYTPDELGAVTDESGEPIDVDAVPVPTGFAKPPRPLRPEEQAADPAAHFDLQLRIAALGEAGQAHLREQWKLAQVPPLSAAWSAADLRRAEALVNGSASVAKRDGHDPEQAYLDAEAELSSVVGRLVGVALGGALPAAPSEPVDNGPVPVAQPEPSVASGGPVEASPGQSEEPTADEFARVTAEVRDMDRAALAAALAEAGLNPAGATALLRQRLAAFRLGVDLAEPAGGAG